MNRKSYVGSRFGKLLVTEMIYEKKNGRPRTSCRCTCDCGNEIVTKIDSLRRTKQSCGCDVKQRRINAIRKDLTGQRFNRLVVDEMLWEYRPTKCRCVCDCGSIIEVIATALTSGKTGSCGCYQKDVTSQSNVKDWTGVVSSFGVVFIKQVRKNEKGQWLWLCKCGECGKEFTALPAKVANGHVTSCGCRKQSSRESSIKKLLDDLAVPYIEQHRFDDCRYKYSLPFDFAILNGSTISLLIEYDGRQHFQPVDYFGGLDEFTETMKRDAIKNAYCKENNYNLLRLPYTLTDCELKQKIIDAIYP